MQNVANAKILNDIHNYIADAFQAKAYPTYVGLV